MELWAGSKCALTNRAADSPVGTTRNIFLRTTPNQKQNKKVGDRKTSKRPKIITKSLSYERKAKGAIRKLVGVPGLKKRIERKDLQSSRNLQFSV
jgi:hypothetical protein